MSASSKFKPDSQDSRHAEQARWSSDSSLLSRMNAVRLIVVTFIMVGYTSTMAIGPGSREWLNLFGYDPSLYGLQVLFFLSGWLAWRSLSEGRSVQAFIRTRAAGTMPTVIVYTAIVTVVLYPILCDHDAPVIKNLTDLGAYFLKTVTLVQPGNPMPGALDGAAYPCLLQGTIWTLRWGVIAYILLLIMYGAKLRHSALYGLGLIGISGAHVGLNAWTDATASEAFASLLPGIRLGMAFLLGIVVRQSMHKLPQHSRGWAVLSVVFLAIAALNYYVFTWTYSIELIATLGWCALAMTLLYAKFDALTHWPKIIVPAYLGIWPITQLWLAALPSITVLQLVMISIATTFAVAFLFRGLEKLALRPIHRRVQTA